MLTKHFWLTGALFALCTLCATAQDSAELRIRKALEGRQAIVKMDLPAIDSGISMIFDDTNITFDEVNYKNLVKEYGVAIKSGTKARITGVRVSPRGIEIDLDGGGSPERDWLVGNVRLAAPSPLQKTDRELDLERQVRMETNGQTLNMLKDELDFEQKARFSQDDRNRDAFERVSRYRNQYLKENRKNWGSKIIIVIRTKKDSTPLRDLVKSLGKYVELLPREPAAK